MTREQADIMLRNSRSKARTVTQVFEKNLKVLADLVGDACAYAIPGGKNQHILAKDFYSVENGVIRHTLTCEAKIVNLKGKAVLIILRDRTERLKLHKAESRLRKIDGNATRLTARDKHHLE